MKYLSCQPDSHNAFVSLTNCTLTYFTVDCARYQIYASTFPASGEKTARRRPNLPSAGVYGDTKQPGGSSSITSTQGSTPSSSPFAATMANVPSAQVTKAYVQSVVLLPDCFRAQSSCFGMANRSLFGSELAFVGTSKGLLALVVPADKSVIFAPNRDPDSARDAEKHQRLYPQSRGTVGCTSPEAARRADNGGAVPVGGGWVNGSGSSNGGFRSVSADGRCGANVHGSRERAAVFCVNHHISDCVLPPGDSTVIGEDRLSDASIGGLGSSFSSSARESGTEDGVLISDAFGVSPRAADDAGDYSSEPSLGSSYPSTFRSSNSYHRHGHNRHRDHLYPTSSSTASEHRSRSAGDGGGDTATTTAAHGHRRRLTTRLEAPSTITWMRDKPLIFVGYTSGRVEWYRVRMTPARQQQLADSSLDEPYRAVIPVSGLAHYVSDPQIAAAARVTRATTRGCGDGIVVELVASRLLHDTGALVTSDYFPAHGGVVVGGERCIVLLSVEQPTAPLCRLPNFGCSFLYCHPILPLVGTLSWGWNTVGPCYYLTVTGAGGESFPVAAAAGSTGSESAPSTSPRVFVGNPNGYGGGCLLNILELKDAVATTITASTAPAAAAPGATPTGGAGADDATTAVANGRGSGATPAAVSATATTTFPTNGPSSTRNGRVAPPLAGNEAAYGAEPTTAVARDGSGAAVMATMTSTVATTSTSGPSNQSLFFRHVQQRLMESHAPRYGAYFSFSWKFSFDLELSVCNVEEGLLHIIRLRHRPGLYGAGGSAAIMTNTTTATTAASGDANAAAAAGSIGVHTQHACGESNGLVPNSPFPYEFVHEHRLRLPLHSLVNVEYVSAATSALAGPLVPNAVAAVARGSRHTGNRISAMGNGGANKLSRRGPVVAAAAVEVTSVGAAAAPAHFPTLFKGQESLTHSAALASLRTGNRGSSEVGFSTAGGFGLLGRGLRNRGTGGLDAAATALASVPPCYSVSNCIGEGVRGLYGSTAKMSNGHVSSSDETLSLYRFAASDFRSHSAVALRENVLAAELLQPLSAVCRRKRRKAKHSRCVTGATGAAGAEGSGAGGSNSGGGSSHRRHSGALPPSKSSSMRGGVGGAASTVVATSAGGGVAPSDAITGGGSGEELHDLRTLLRVGPGATSSIVGMNAAGEVTSIPVEVEAIATWHEEGSVFVGLGSTICAADIVTIQGIERQMKRRMECGFRLSPEENVRALRDVARRGQRRTYAGVNNETSTLSMSDLSTIFSYVSLLSQTGVIGPVGEVPSMCQLLLRQALHNDETHVAGVLEASALPPAVRRLYEQLRQERAVASALTSLPAHTIGVDALSSCSSTAHGSPSAASAATTSASSKAVLDPTRLLLLHILHWLPPTFRESDGQQLHAPGEQSEDDGALTLHDDSGGQEVERAVAVQVLHGRYAAGAAILRRFGDRHPGYRAMANLIILGHDSSMHSRGSGGGAAIFTSDARVRETFLSSLSPWLLAVFLSLSADCEDTQSYRARIYANPYLPLWDRVAIALILERDAERLLVTLHDTLLRDCTLLQALTLVHGVSSATYPIMQEIIDGTGDFQLGACLYARVGVLSPHFTSLYPRAATTASATSWTGAAIASGLGAEPVGFYTSPLRRSATSSSTVAAALFCLEEDDLNADTTAAAAATGNDACSRRRRSHADATPVIASPPDPLRRGPQHALSVPVLAPMHITDGNGVITTMMATTSMGTATPATAASRACVVAPRASTPSRMLLHCATLAPVTNRLPCPLTARIKGPITAWAIDARLQRSVLPPPAAPPPALRALIASPPASPPPPPLIATSGDCETSLDPPWAAVSTDGAAASAASIVIEEAEDCPWVWWASAYRAFLDSEQAFVERTMFDVACKRLREEGLSALAGTSAAGPSPSSPQQMTASAKGSATWDTAEVRDSSGNSKPGWSPRQRNCLLRVFRGTGAAPITASFTTTMTGNSASPTNAAASHAAGVAATTSVAVATPTAATSGATTPWGVPASPICRRDGMPEAALVAKTTVAQALAQAQSKTVATAGTALTGASTLGLILSSTLITPEQYRMVLGALSNREPRCAVCLEPVKVHRRESGHSLAWCTACQHGGHAVHLQLWFAQHRKCPVYGCRCRCDEDASMY